MNNIETISDASVGQVKDPLYVVDQFLDAVFPELDHNEHLLFWATKTTQPGFPSSEQHFRKTFPRSKNRAAYIGTSSMYPGDEGRLFNRQNLFHSLYILVLDDIGTGLGSKVSPDDVPQKLRDMVTYRIESSPDNEQWGFVLDEPVTDLEHAKTLVSLFVGGSGADTGGCMPNKLVRLPVGVNLKDKYSKVEGELFHCQLLELNPNNLWSPDQLLKGVDAGVAWDDVLAGHATQSKLSTRQGTAAYRQGAYMPNLDGVEDPVLDWLNDRGMVVSEGNAWQTITCPWGHDHTTGDVVAGYKPLGLGEMSDRRAFHCFHDSCSGNRSGEFLSWVVENGGPAAPIVDPVGELVAKYSLDMSTNEVINMKSGRYDRLPVGGFRTGHMRDVWVSDQGGKWKKFNEYGLFIKDLNLLRLSGVRRQPGDVRMIEDGDDLLLNTWALPDWGIGEYDTAMVEPFIDFINYLLPEGDDAEWFINHLAMKAQNPRYRGAGVIMTTPVQGTGRGTLEAIIRQLWGAWNTNTLRFSELIKGVSGDGFNDWVRGDWLIVPEAKEASMTGRTESRAYESLKSFVEPAGVMLRINRKNVPEWYEECFGSVIICSQHENILNTEGGDTRFRRFRNTVQPRNYHYFKELRAWMASGFEAHLWRYLLARDLSGFEPYARESVASLTDQLERALDSGSAIDGAIQLLINYADAQLAGVLSVNEASSWLEGLVYEIGLDRIDGWQRIVKRELKNQTQAMHRVDGSAWQIRVNDRPCRPRHTITPRGFESSEILIKTTRKTRDKLEQLKDTIRGGSSEGLKDFYSDIAG